MRRNSKSSAMSALKGKTTITLFNQEGVREMLVPSDQPNYHPVVINETKMLELRKKAEKVERKDLIKERERLAELSNQRKAKFQEIDKKAMKKSEKLTDLEQEAREKANYLLQRAWQLRMEQEDEVKAANSLILKTKCQAIRDAQLAERAINAKQLLEDEQRIEKEMEEERVRKMIEEKRALEVKRGKHDRYIKELTQQISEINLKKQMEFENIIQERQHLNEAVRMMMTDEIKKQKELKISKLKTRKELALANEKILKAHLMEKEEARLADLKVQEWMRQRAEREEALDKEQAEVKKRKELEIARLRSMQEKAGELQVQQEHMMAVRRQEEYEREWRKKELEAARKRKEMDEKLMEVRSQQVNELRLMQAIEIAKQEREMERIQKLQKEAEEREKMLAEERRCASEKYRETLLRQMNEKEANLIADRGENLAEGIAIRAEAVKREEEVKRVLQTKVDQLRLHKVPEIYVADIMRQLHLTK